MVQRIRMPRMRSRRSPFRRGKTRKLGKGKPTRFRFKRTATGQIRLGFRDRRVVETTTFTRRRRIL